MIYCRGCHLLETIFCQIRHWLKTLNTPRKLHPKLRSKLRRLRRQVLKLTKPENFTDLQQPGIFLIQSFCFIDQNSDQNSEITLIPEDENFGGASKVIPEGWVVTVSCLTLAVIFSITPFLYQSSSVCYAHSQMQKRSMVYLFWTMGYSDQAVRNKTFNSN